MRYVKLTTADFVECGVRRADVEPALAELEALGFIKVSKRGSRDQPTKGNTTMLKRRYCTDVSIRMQDAGGGVIGRPGVKTSRAQTGHTASPITAQRYADEVIARARSGEKPPAIPDRAGTENATAVRMQQGADIIRREWSK